MTTPPAGISEMDWLATPVSVRALVLAQQEQIESLQQQLTALATELASLHERIGRNSRNSSRPPSSDGLGVQAACPSQQQWPQAGWAAGPSRHRAGTATGRAR